MIRPTALLLRAGALAIVLGVAACGAEQRDLATISGMPDAPFVAGRGASVHSWGNMSTGGRAIVMHRELPQ